MKCYWIIWVGLVLNGCLTLKRLRGGVAYSRENGYVDETLTEEDG